jgi:hypothetical protein
MVLNMHRSTGERGRKIPTLSLIAPALISTVSVTLWLGYRYVKDGSHSSTFEFGPDLLMPWIALAGLAFATSLLGAVVFFVKSRRMDR